MGVYCVKNERGWLFKEQPVPRISGTPEDDKNALALMVYVTEEDALEDALADPEGSADVVEMRSPEVITEGLEEGRFRYVRIRLDKGEGVVCALPGWRHAVEHGMFN